MRDEDERAIVLFEGADERVDGGHVQVRRGLVHQQQIGRVEQQFDQSQPRLLPTAEYRHGLEHVIATEQKCAAQRARHLF